MERYDVVVMGLDPTLSRDDVVAAVAAHLSSSPAAIERLLRDAPTAIVLDVAESDARRLVTDLRQLGARVKPRAAGAALPSSPPPSRASSRPPLAEIELSSLSPSGMDDLPMPEPRLPSAAPPPFSSSLETEAVPAPPRARPPQHSAPPPRLIDVPEREERPRAFWTALPEAFVVPFRGHALYGLLGAPFLAVGAMIAGSIGLRLSLLSALVALVLGFGFLGATLQVARRCLWATAVGERAPDPLPSDLMSDYMFTGAGVLFAQSIFGGIAGWLTYQLVSYGAPPLVTDAFLLFVALYGVIGFALSAANGSATGYLDVGRILRILAKAPIHVLVVATLGALVQGAALYGASVQLLRVSETGELGTILMSLGLVGFLLSFAVTYGAALTATMMGMLFYAKPEVAT